MLPLHENHVDFLSAKQSLSADIEFQSSLPVRGAWIEIIAHLSHWTLGRKSLPARGAWIESWALSKMALIAFA